MNHGIGIDTSHSVDRVIDDVRQARDAGFASAGCSQIFGYDALSLLAVVGSQVPDIELVTAVVPTYPRHPIVLAAQALTVQAATGGRLTLGIGLSHQMVIEGMFGYSFEKPARHMREYLSALMPLLNGEQIAVHGETLTAATMGPLDVHAPAPKGTKRPRAVWRPARHLCGYVAGHSRLSAVGSRWRALCLDGARTGTGG
jgi:alkanesulfonate monooxygenase SsuD/methylene tetrahydromethanopterin reductase-like flavin-dependent oxidoreductase (luciferase family)